MSANSEVEMTPPEVASTPSEAVSDGEMLARSEPGTKEDNVTGQGINEDEQTSQPEGESYQYDPESNSALSAKSEADALKISMEAFQAFRDGSLPTRYLSEFHKHSAAHEEMKLHEENLLEDKLKFMELPALEKINKLTETAVALFEETATSLLDVRKLTLKFKTSARLSRQLTTEPSLDETVRNCLFSYSILSHYADLFTLSRKVKEMASKRMLISTLFQSTEDNEEFNTLMRTDATVAGEMAEVLSVIDWAEEIFDMLKTETESLDGVQQSVMEYGQYAASMLGINTGRPEGVQTDDQA